MGATAQERINMTALRGKSRILIQLRLQLNCAKPTFPLDAASVCKQQRRVGINLRFLKNIEATFQVAALFKEYRFLLFCWVRQKLYCFANKKGKATTCAVSIVEISRTFVSAKEDVGPETGSAKQSCFGSALSRRNKVFLVTFVTIDKSNPSGAVGQKPLAQPGTT